MASRLFCFGLGYSAKFLAGALRAEGWRIAGTCRSEDKRRALEAVRIEAFAFERARPLADARAALAGATHLLCSVPPDAQGDAVLDGHEGDIAACRPAWIGYLSTTGVYGDRGGAWVDETGELRPTNPRSRWRAEAEAAWLESGRRHGLAVHVFRLAGIYGPGRSALDQMRAGSARRIDKPGQVFGRIHVADIAATLRASMARPNPGAIYNVCDDDPAPPAAVIEEACRLLGVPPPPLEPFESAKATMSEMALGFYADNKRVNNDRIKKELGVRLAFPDYRAGLRALLTQT